MGAERSPADVELDRALRAALNADPSPEFLARIRSRVSEEQEPGRWRIGPVMALAAAVATVLVVGILASRSSRPPARIETSAARHPGVAADPAAQVELPPAPPTATVERRAAERRVGPRGERRTIVRDSRGGLALRELQQAADRAAVLAALSATGEDRQTAIPDLTIPPITISAITVDPITQ